MPEVQSVETEDEYIHVRFRDPEQYDTIRTADWAKDPAESVSEGAEVRTGKKEGSDDWEVQSILIKKSVGEGKTEEQAKEILDKIDLKTPEKSPLSDRDYEYAVLSSHTFASIIANYQGLPPLTSER